MATPLSRPLQNAYKPETAGIKVATHYLRSGTSSTTTTSNPYRGTTKSGWTRTKLDNLGRVVEVGHLSGATRPSASATPTWGTTTTAYDTEYTTVTDPAGKTRRSRLDGLGRLVRVDEPTGSPGALGTTGSPNQATSYSYHALDNLTGVTQGSQRRTFVYDSLSRLTSASNPENRPSPTGVSFTYTYDNNGNLTRRTDARSVVTAYTYDRLDRLTRRSYSYSGSDTAVSLETTRVDYAYDRCGSYSRGRLCSVTAKKGATQVSRTAYNRYDALGRVLESTQTTGGSSYTMAYAYDRAGNLTSQRYPSDRVVDYVYDGAGRIAGAKTGIDDWYAGGTGSNAVDYEPHGGVRQLLLGNALWEQRRYNARLQPTQIGLGTAKTTGGLTATGSGLVLLDYSYGAGSNNGNVLSQRIRVGNSFNQNQTYTYDALNRLKTAAESGSGTAWSQTYAYDRYGNRRVTAGAAHGSNQALTPQSTADIAGTNRLAGTKGVNLTVAYDAAGNIKADWAGRGFKYDGDNRLVSFDTTGTDSDTTYSLRRGRPPGPQGGRRLERRHHHLRLQRAGPVGGRVRRDGSRAAGDPLPHPRSPRQHPCRDRRGPVGPLTPRLPALRRGDRRPPGEPEPGLGGHGLHRLPHRRTRPEIYRQGKGQRVRTRLLPGSVL